jgi:hypothetical protein
MEINDLRKFHRPRLHLARLPEHRTVRSSQTGSEHAKTWQAWQAHTVGISILVILGQNDRFPGPFNLLLRRLVPPTLPRRLISPKPSDGGRLGQGGRKLSKNKRMSATHSKITLFAGNANNNRQLFSARTRFSCLPAIPGNSFKKCRHMVILEEASKPLRAEKWRWFLFN